MVTDLTASGAVRWCRWQSLTRRCPVRHMNLVLPRQVADQKMAEAPACCCSRFYTSPLSTQNCPAHTTPRHNKPFEDVVKSHGVSLEKWCFNIVALQWLGVLFKNIKHKDPLGFGRGHDTVRANILTFLCINFLIFRSFVGTQGRIQCVKNPW